MSYLRFALLLSAAWLACAAHAQHYPSKPVRVVVPFVAGGTSDILARLLGAKLTESWGQQVIADNRPGASGMIGAEIVARAAPDGHTLLLMDVGALTIGPSILPRLAIDPLKDLAPLTMISYSPHLLVVHPSVPAESVKQLVALAKARKGQLNVGSTGLGSAPHMAALLFAYRSGIDWAYIPAKGGAQSIMDTASGQADVLFNGMLATYPHVKSGKLKLLAVSSAKRVATLKDTPTIAESGLPGFVTGSWQGLLAPAALPRELVTRINADFVRVLNTPDVREKLSTQGADPVANPPEQFGEWLKSEQARWAKLVKDTGFKMD